MVIRQLWSFTANGRGGGAGASATTRACRLPFTYAVKDGGFFPSRTNYRISRSDFEKACQIVPISGPGEISRMVRGSAYIWAVLHDARISGGRW